MAITYCFLDTTFAQRVTVNFSANFPTFSVNFFLFRILKHSTCSLKCLLRAWAPHNYLIKTFCFHLFGSQSPVLSCQMAYLPRQFIIQSFSAFHCKLQPHYPLIRPSLVIVLHEAVAGETTMHIFYQQTGRFLGLSKERVIMVCSVRVVQVSSKTCLVSFRADSGVVGKIKKYGGQWNSFMGGYEVPLTHLHSLMNRMKNQGIQIDEIPTQALHQLINDGRKSNRVLLYDSTLFKRYTFLNSFISTSNPKKSFRNILLFCFESARDQWISRSIESSCLIQFGCPARPMDHSLSILTFQKLRDHGDILTRQILNEFTTIIVDDTDIIFNRDHAIYNCLSEVPAIITETLKDKHAWDKDLMLIVNKLQFSRPALILEICSLLRPKEFGFDQLKIMCREVNDASWMKRRYRKENKHAMKELMYVLKATVLVSLEGFEENRIIVNLLSHSIDRFKAIDNRYRKLDRKGILVAFQTERMKNAHVYSDGCKLEEAKYLKEVRETMLSEKMPWVFRQIYKMVKEVGLKMAIIVENYTLQEKLQKFMNESQIGYNVYEAACGASYDRFNLNDNLRVLVVNREKLVKDWRRSRAEQECKDKDILAEEFGEQNKKSLKQITSVRHILVLDSYWHQFSEEKQALIHKIFPLQLPHSQSQSIQKHFLICRDSYEGSILDRYNQNVRTLLKELPWESIEEEDPVSDLAKRMVSEAQSKYQKCTKVAFLDIDDEFDKVEFAALQQKRIYQMTQVTDEVESQIEYNTHIEGLQTETPCLLDRPTDIAVKLAIINPIQEIDLIDLVEEEGKIKRRKPKKKEGMERSEDILAEIKKKNNKDFLWYHSEMPKHPKVIRVERQVRIKLIPNKSTLIDQ